MMRKLCLVLIAASGCGDSHGPVDVSQDWTPVDLKPGWGDFVDPDGDCKQTWKDGTLTINVPGNAHELQANGQRNAPRLMIERPGDFAMNVRAAGKLAPQQSTGGKFAPYHGAGILIMENDRLFTRLERAKISQPSGKTLTYINFEQQSSSGAQPIKQLQLADDEIVFLRVERRQKKIVGLMSRDGTSWEKLGELSLETTGPVKVGVAAVNNSLDAFSPEFSDIRFFEAKKPK